MELIKFRITGTRPLLMHADTLADPLNPLSKVHKELTTKRKKTDEDFEMIAKSEWRASFYFDEEIGPYIPAFNIEASIKEGAKISRLGKHIERGVEILEEKSKLEYQGPRTLNELWNAGFYDARTVKVSTSRIMRYRPMFRTWATEFTVVFDNEVINRNQVIKCVKDAGEYAGIGDYRPKFGRFKVEVIS